MRGAISILSVASVGIAPKSAEFCRSRRTKIHAILQRKIGPQNRQAEQQNQANIGQQANAKIKGKQHPTTPQSERTAGAWRRVFVRLALCRRMLREPATAEPYAPLLRLDSHQPNKPSYAPMLSLCRATAGMPCNPIAMFLIMPNFAEATPPNRKIQAYLPDA